MTSTRHFSTNSNDGFVEISFKQLTNAGIEAPTAKGEAVYSDWKKENSHTATDPGMAFTNVLREKYKGWSIVRVGSPYSFPVTGYPEMMLQPIPSETFDSIIAAFLPFARKSGRSGGLLLEQIKCGGFMGAWKSWDFIVYQVIFPFGMFQDMNMWILHEGEEAPAYSLLNAVGTWAQELHEEVLIYDQGFWQKNHELYVEIQKAEWKDVILKDKFKKAIQGDISDFFKSEAVYKELAVPWKRGLIFYGPAGNGKTVSLKAAMHGTKHPILYVRTLTNYQGDEKAMADIFGMARRHAPCMLVLEDIDSHINERNRSFFLNQLDGLDNNDGILLLATTNHLDRLDNSISGRPSRFDRKYLFDDPDEEERRLYCSYWQRKLSSNKKIEFPDTLVDEIAKKSDGLSFAYIKEAFVSTLVLLAGNEELCFAETLKAQVKELKDQLKEHPPSLSNKNFVASFPKSGEPSELGYTRELLQRLAGPEPPRGLVAQSIIPSTNMSLRRWI